MGMKKPPEFLTAAFVIWSWDKLINANRLFN